MNIYFFYIFFLLILFCNYPYQFLIKKFETPLEKKENIYQDQFLYVEGLNECVDYQLIFATPLEEPFLYTNLGRRNLLLEKQFFWIRAYFKNKFKESLDLNRIFIFNKKEDKKIFSYNFFLEDLIQKYPIYLEEKPIFWYAIPKDPILYFLDNYDWWEEFYTRMYSLKYHIRKINYYKDYFKNQNFFTLESDKETLFYLIFPNLEEDPHTEYDFVADWKECKIKIPFRMKLELTKEYKSDKEIEKVILKLRNQNKEWQLKLAKELKKHYYKEKFFLDTLFED